MKTWFPLSLGFCSKFKAIAIITGLSLLALTSLAKETVEVVDDETQPTLKDLMPQEFDRASSWEGFSKIMERQREREKIEGISYIVSGTLILLGGEVGYRNSQDDIQKFAYSFAQSLSVGAIGYGIYNYHRGSPANDVYQMLSQTQGLTLAQREEMLRIYLDGHYHRRNGQRWIRILSHSLIAALNISKAGQTDDPNLKNALYVVGGLNALAAISISF